MRFPYPAHWFHGLGHWAGRRAAVLSLSSPGSNASAAHVCLSSCLPVSPPCLLFLPAWCLAPRRPRIPLAPCILTHRSLDLTHPRPHSQFGLGFPVYRSPIQALAICDYFKHLFCRQGRSFFITLTNQQTKVVSCGTIYIRGMVKAIGVEGFVDCRRS